jgi:hypothetical protein
MKDTYGADLNRECGEREQANSCRHLRHRQCVAGRRRREYRRPWAAQARKRLRRIGCSPGEYRGGVRWALLPVSVAVPVRAAVRAIQSRCRGSGRRDGGDGRSGGVGRRRPAICPGMWLTAPARAAERCTGAVAGKMREGGGAATWAEWAGDGRWPGSSSVQC